MRGGSLDGLQPGTIEWRYEMNTLKRLMVALLALLPLAAGMADDSTDLGYDRMFVFGASFLDPGNHFVMTGETAHPPFELLGPSYGVGGHHFSNGPIWVEVMAQDMGLTKWAQPAYRNPAFGNYAYGYGRARDPFEGEPDFIEPNLSAQVAAWKANGYCTFVPMDDTLFIVDSAYRDGLDFVTAPNPMVILLAWVDGIEKNIGDLYTCGARNFLVPYLPPLEASPIAGAPDPEASPPLSPSMIFNLMLQDRLTALSTKPGINIKTVDFFTLVSGIVMYPDMYGFTNATDSCVAFGVTEGAFCKDRDRYVFWDPLHPTKKVHALLAEEALVVLTE